MHRVIEQKKKKLKECQ